MAEGYTDAIWGANHRIKISAILANRLMPKNSKFKKPSGVVSSKYEIETFPAELPSANTPSYLISTELFKKGTEPSEVSSRFETLEAPTKGEGSETNGNITISWKGIKTPNAVNKTYLTTFFKENYGQFATEYLNKRLDFNATALGDLGYNVYLRNENGEETYLGFTTDTFFNYEAERIGNHTFIVRSAYRIFQVNMSKGLTITVHNSTNTTPVLPEEPDNGEPTTPPTNGEETTE